MYCVLVRPLKYSRLRF
ncbi:hypothetical protein V6N11_047780 [Hibiscus sabdariffa]|uniref:Uncharacterized protein n=1 Tax=Hibiscus sabdariffa TaxID=183260 RepID=A0ABR2P8C0_9ROSI